MPLFELVHTPEFSNPPVLVQHLEGWIDAGLGAATAVRTILESSETVTVASFDSDILLDHRSHRPSMKLVDGVYEGVAWPGIELVAATDADGREFLLLYGVEPDHNWRAFAAGIADLAMELGVERVVGLGAYPAAVPHTRPPRISPTATSEQLANFPGFVRGSIEVPAGIQAIIEIECGERGIPALGIWAQVPHYVATMPYPPASVALMEALFDVTGLRFEIAALRSEAESVRNRIDALIRANPEHVAMVRRLEEAHDTFTTGGGDLPTGEEIAQELQRFLSEQSGDSGLADE
ncbi:MAG: hypothetical protein KatS3mg008_1985 [Acidimicrobiales bacterium]|nr:MAG: hypothetical protein KatS3mg008_1985 [Acidimicrobiales bacterium]